MASLLKNKKGDVTDPIIILIILFFLAVSFIVGIYINTKIQNDVIGNTALNQSSAYSAINTSFNSVNLNGVQNAFVMIFAVLIIFTIGSAFLFRVHPVFMFMYIFFLGFTIIAAVFIGNTYDKLKQNDELASVIAQQPKIDYIMDNLVKIIMVIGGLSMLIVFSKFYAPPTGQGGFG